MFKTRDFRSKKKKKMEDDDEDDDDDDDDDYDIWNTVKGGEQR